MRFVDYMLTPWECNLKAKPGLVFNIFMFQKDRIFDAVSNKAENREFKIVSISLYVEHEFKNSMSFGTPLSGRTSLKPLFLSTQSSLPELSPGFPGSRLNPWNPRKWCQEVLLRVHLHTRRGPG